MLSLRIFSAVLVALTLAACSSGEEDSAVTSNDQAFTRGCSVSTEGATKLAEWVGGAHHFVASGDTLFAASGRTVVAVPLAGGQARALATTPKDIRALAVDGERVYALTTSASSHDLVAISKSTGALTTLARAPTYSIWDVPAVLALHGTKLFWTECGDFAVTSGGFVKSLDLQDAAATPTVLARGTCPRALAVDDTHAYWAGTRGGVSRVALSDGTTEPVGGVFVAGASLFLDGEWVYWHDAVDVVDRKVSRRARSLASPPETVLTKFDYTLYGIGDGKLAFGSRGTAFTYDTRTKTARNVVCFSEGRGTSIDSKHVYWSTSDAIYLGSLEPAVAR